jgi:PAS domain S-box-containing protein
MRVTDCHGRIVAVNAAFCRMMNMDASQLEGQPLTVTQQAEQHKDVMEHHLRLFASHSVDQPYERKLFLRSGGTLDVEISSAFIELENEPPLMLSIYRDITERRQAEEQRLALERKLLDSQKLESLGILAGGIAHDFNNLLTAVMGNTELAMMELSETSPTRPYLEEIEKTTLQAADLCRQMLAYSGRGKFVIQRVGVNGIIEEMTHLLQISISKKNMLKFHLSPGLPAVEVDAAQMRQVIMNLVINASEAIGDKSGVITVSTGVMRADADYLYETYLGTSLSEGDYVYIEVSDTGCGMSSSTRTKIFDPFFTTKFTGRGLGLAAVLGIVRGHKGCLKVYSETGRGSTFKFLLPCAPGGPSELSGQPAGHALWHGSGTVLVVDDEETVRTVTARMLEKFGFKVLTASDGQQGVDVYRKHTKEISVVVLDMTMPRLSGEEAFTEMRRIRPDARVILTSGYNEQDATNRFAGKGLAGFLQKPFKPDVLYEKLMTVIGKDGKDGEAPKKT